MSDAVWQPIGTVEVDSGCVVLGDPTYLLPSAQRERPGIDYQVVIDADWRQAVTPIASGMALLFQGFGGDGSYPVSGLFEDGRLVAVRVDFVEPE